MRQAKHALDALLPRTRQLVLAAVMMHPGRWWYRSDLARHLGVTPSSLQRELSALVGAGILRRKQEGGRVYYQADVENPIFPDLQSLVAKTAGLVSVLQSTLKSVRDRIVSAFVYGSIARSTERSPSDIDLMVIGRVRLSELSPLLRRAEERLARPVNATLHTPIEFRKRVAAKNPFLHNVLEKEKLFVIGGEHDLERAGISRPRRTT